LIVTVAIVLSACGGGGGGDDGGNVPPPPSSETVTVSGRISFDRAPFASAADSGLDIANPIESPAREVIVEAIDSASNSILATTTTDESGDYSLDVPVNRSVFIRAKAQMLKDDAAPTWNFRVLNNTNSDALYALDSSAFNSGTADSTRNLRATTGWGGSSYTGTRAAAPFAILDTVYQAKALVLSADEDTAFPELNLFWSPDNRPASPLCPDDGNIETMFYTGGDLSDRCTPSEDLPAGIYVLGDFASGGGDTDEFDQHVIAHELGHYYEDQFSRSDSIGGEHGDPGAPFLDMRVAFGEGWGNAYSGMALNDPVYRDSSMGVDTDFDFDIEDDFTDAEGWYSEMSVAEIIWDIYDSGTESGDTLALGFGPIHDVMTGPQVTTEALTSIYTFAEGFRTEHPSDATAINALLNGEGIFGRGEFGQDETNFAGLEETTEPIYVEIALNGEPKIVCTNGSSDGNKAGNNRFLRFDLGSASLVAIQAAATPSGGNQGALDPDIFVYRRGDLVVSGAMEGTTETIAARQFDAGTYVLEVYDFGNTNSSVRCMSISITGG
jgi:hypothetical protein